MAKNSGAIKNNWFTNIWDKHWQKILAGIVFVGIIGFIGVNQLIIYNQKQEFIAAEKSLDLLYAGIIKATGQPKTVAKDKSCNYAGLKTGEGDRSCGIVYQMSYDVDNIQKANDMFTKINSSVPNQTYGDITTKSPLPSTLLETTDPGSYTVSGAEITSNIKNLTCTSLYYYGDDLPKSPIAVSFSIKLNSFAIILSCGGPAKTDLYPVKS